jgi:hypothetical protein
MPICSKCGSIVSYYDKTCPKCGSSLSNLAADSFQPYSGGAPGSRPYTGNAPNSQFYPGSGPSTQSYAGFGPVSQSYAGVGYPTPPPYPSLYDPNYNPYANPDGGLYPGGYAYQSPLSKTTCLLLCGYLGWLGVHRFYAGKIGTGVLMLLTSGGLGLWTIIDFILICVNQFRDDKGQPVSRPCNLTLIIFAFIVPMLLLCILGIIMAYYSNFH